MEVLQALLTTTRPAEILDVAADAAGSVSALLVVELTRRVWDRPSVSKPGAG